MWGRPCCGANSWSGERLSGSVSLQSSWGGWLGQTVAERLTQDPSRFHPETGAWMVRQGVPLVQHQRHLVQWHLAPQSVAFEALESACSRSGRMGRGGGEHSVFAFGAFLLVGRSQWHPRLAPEGVGAWQPQSRERQFGGGRLGRPSSHAVDGVAVSLGVSLGPCLVRRRRERLAAWGGRTGGDEMGRH